MIEFLKKTSFAAGQVILEGFRKGGSFRHKTGPRDILTETDEKTQHFLYRTIMEEAPKHFPKMKIGFVGEESGVSAIGDITFVVDPIDGTSNFEAGFPYFAVSIGVVKGNELLAGIVYDPVSKNCFFGEKDKGAFKNDSRIKIKKGRALENSLLFTHRRTFFLTFGKQSFPLRDIRINGAIALDLCNVASGAGELMLTRSGHVWDYSAGVLIVREAGGEVADWKGNPLLVRLEDRDTKYSAVAGDPELLKKFLPFIKSFNPEKIDRPER